ncbi:MULTISPECIES: snapalysin family zinc-dependent metalloprotease [Streptomyces]|uniref:snapalysin family zinc-dependent metalloprotease n=1 Tax=Streptomyces TaxID=1883 RepID=UPI00234A21F8|nr:snapalysin family zinc-dependent metalloprotease [Streptomyces sp. JCM 35825]WCL89223.1 snapalysin family zinc-dependent metalloprotease [Streptomyces sp. JCM 35825]
MVHFLRLGIAGASAGMLLTAVPAAHAVSAAEPTTPKSVAAQVTLRYDASRAAGWEQAISAGVASWNGNVGNVKLVKAAPGSRAEIQIVATTGWPQATLGPVRPGGRGRVELGSQAVSQGYDKTRIVAHELGHNLGLPDTKPGPCSQLMSGSSAGTGCRNAVPDAAERSRVENAYANGAAAPARTDGRVLVDAP